MSLMRRRTLILALLTAGALLAALAGATPAMASTAWLKLATASTPTNMPPGQQATINLFVTNLGDANVPGAEHPVTITDKVPAGFEITGAKPATCLASGKEGVAPEKPVCARKWPQFEKNVVKEFPECTFTATEATCKLEEPLAPYERWEMSINVNVAPSIPSGSKALNQMTVTGGGLETKTLNRELTVNGEQTPFGLENLDFTVENEAGAPETQAGSHPFQFTTAMALNRIYQKFPTGAIEPSVPAPPKNLKVNLPTGLIGNASKEVIPQCTELQFTTSPKGGINECPEDTAVGAAVVTVTEPDVAKAVTVAVPVYNLVPAPGEPARFGFLASVVPVTIDTVVREGDYHVVANVNNASEEAALLSSEVTIWGTPSDPSHDQSRGSQCIAREWEPKAREGEKCELLKNPNPQPFIIMPGSCAEPLRVSVAAQSWLPGATFLEPFPAAGQTQTGCDKLPFTPSMSVTPVQHEASTPTGLRVNLHVPQPSIHDVKGIAEANLRNTTVALPQGVQLNPSAANGLAACGLAEIGFIGVNHNTGANEFSPNAVTCPDASKVGTVSISTPVLEHVLHGSVYLAAQNENPFGSLFAIYIVVEDPITGVLVKLAGEVHLDPSTGQVTNTFPNAPQLPFEDLTLEIFDGPRAPLATPRACGGYTTLTSLTPWSGQPAVEQALSPEEFNITSGPHGTGCAGALAFNPGFEAGSNQQAGQFTAFTLSLSVPDGDQQLSSLSLSLPGGLAGIVKNVARCPDAQANAGTCPPQSLIGHVTAVAGFGPTPVTIGGGRVYLTEKYAGAPFGLSIVIPAKTGPFDFGNTITRSTINVDRNTAAITIGTPSVPTMVNTDRYGAVGVPVQLRRLDVTVDRPEFQFNPTNCSPMQITGATGGDQGGSMPIAYPFQATGCNRLSFAPELTAETSSNVTKLNGTSLVVKVKSAFGQANIAKTKIEFPEQLPSRLSTIQKACPDSVFEKNPATCPEGSVIGTAIAHTPVLENPLVGPAYLVSHGGAAFPDAEFVLQGEGITLVLDGQTDIKKGITSSTFNAVPDAPVSTFEVILPAGPHSAFTGFGDLCKPTKKVTKRVKVAKKVRHRTIKVFKNVTQNVADPLMMPTVLTGQNGNVIEKKTPLKVSGCKAVKNFKVHKKAKKKKKKSTKKKKK